MTGAAMFDITDSEPIKLWSEEWSEHDFYPKIHDVFTHYSTEDRHLEVVCENFIITVQTAKLGAGPWSLKYIGATAFLCYVHEVSFTLQQPSQKDFAPNPRIKALGFWHKGGGGHALDAIRHGIIYLVMQHKWRPAALLEDDTVDTDKRTETDG